VAAKGLILKENTAVGFENGYSGHDVEVVLQGRWAGLTEKQYPELPDFFTSILFS
jgi:hypothetical protein